MRERIIQDLRIGVMGLGDLGKRLTNQILWTGHNVMAFDPKTNARERIGTGRAINPRLGSNDSGVVSVVDSCAEVLEQCDIVHWAVPSEKLNNMPTVGTDTVAILHDSVMSNSEAAINRRHDCGQFVIAHCLMNDDRRVMVSPEYGNYQTAAEHFVEIGLSPKKMTVTEHDKMMARTQGVFALLIGLGIGRELEIGFADGNLTPSAVELRTAVINRESKWTAETIASILKNPHLKALLDEMMDSLNKFQHSR